jgi:general secretion pathway protein G
MRKTGARGVRRGVRRGFTLIEVMIVIAIVLALTGLIGVAVFSRKDDAKKDMAKTELNQIKNALGLFRLDFDRWPTDQEGVKVLWDKTALEGEEEQAKWKGYLTEALPKDKWGSDWGYRQKGEHGDETKFDLWSYGPDKQEGTEDDITSWGAAASGEGPMEEAPPSSSSRSSTPPR